MEWLRKLTPFQRALVSMLMIAVPYFIAMVAIYVYFGFFAAESERCEALCCHYIIKMKNENPASESYSFTDSTEFSEYDDIFTELNTSIQPTSPTTEYDFEPHYLKWERSVVPIYVRDNITKKYTTYACPGAILDKNKVLVIGDYNCGEKINYTGTKIYAKVGIIDKQIKEKSVPSLKIRPEFDVFEFEEVSSIMDKIETEEDSFLVRMFTFQNDKKVNITFNFMKSIDCDTEDEIDSENHKDHLTCIAASRTNSMKNLKQLGVMVDNVGRLIGFHFQTICRNEEKFCVVAYHKIPMQIIKRINVNVTKLT